MTEGRADETGLQIAPEQGTFMTLLTQLARATSAIEIGTFTGYSSICLARGMGADGKLICCDINADFTALARTYWQRAGLADRIVFDYRRAGLDDRRRAILDYAVKVTVRPLDCGEDDIARLRALGLTAEEVWDVAELFAMYNFTNRLAMATGQLPNEEYHFVQRGG